MVNDVYSLLGLPPNQKQAGDESEADIGQMGKKNQHIERMPIASIAGYTLHDPRWTFELVGVMF